jgi:hypothetical protein
MIERLSRQRRRDFGAGAAHTFVGDAGTHLHEAVEAAPRRPGPGPTIGVERNVDQFRPRAATRLDAEAEPFQRVGAIAVNAICLCRRQRWPKAQRQATTLRPSQSSTKYLATDSERLGSSYCGL